MTYKLISEGLPGIYDIILDEDYYILSDKNVKSIVQFDEQTFLCSIWDEAFLYIIHSSDKNLIEQHTSLDKSKHPITIGNVLRSQNSEIQRSFQSREEFTLVRNLK